MGLVNIQVQSSGQFLNILDESFANGAAACQGESITGNNYLWDIVPAKTPGFFLFQVQSSGQFLNILNGSQANAAAACQGENDSTDNFLWQFVLPPGPMNTIPAPGTPFLLKVKSSNQFLNILNGSQANGAQACQGENDSTNNFLWELVAIPGTNRFHLKVQSSGQFLNILNGSQANGAEACQGNNPSTNNFAWQIIPAGNGFFRLQVESSGQFLNILNGSQANGALACQGENDSTDNFLWQFVQLLTVVSTVPAVGTPFLLKVKSSGQFLNILGGSHANGAGACQGNNPSTNNFIWTLRQPGDVAAPNPLGNNSNYLLYEDCQSIKNLTVTINVEQSIVVKSSTGVLGFSIQLNAYSPNGFGTAWQQFVFALLGGELVCAIQGWPATVNPIDDLPIFSAQFTLGALSQISNGSKIVISLQNDDKGNITGATFSLSVDGKMVVPPLSVNILENAPGATAANLAPIVAFELDIVGPDDGASAVLSSGSGTIVYTVSSGELCAQTSLPPCAAAQDIVTAESANTVYGLLPETPATALTQTFNVVAMEAPIMRKSGEAHRLSLSVRR
jgi:Ricin-type beta-trefoil lectin domain-like